MGLLLVIAVALTYYFHVILETGTVFTHFFYLPIILAALWWRHKGVVVSLFLAGLLIYSHTFLRPVVLTANDYLRAAMFIVLASVVATLSEHLVQAQRATKLALSELSQIFHTAGNGMRVIDWDFNVLRINKTMLELTGATEEEALGKKCHEILRSPLCHTPKCPLTMIRAGNDRIECDVEKECRDGTLIPCILTAVPFKTPEGEVIGVVEDLKDIADRKEAHEKLLKLNRMYSLLHHINNATFHVHGPRQLLQQACRIVTEHGGFPLAWMGLLDDAKTPTGIDVGFAAASSTLGDPPMSIRALPGGLSLLEPTVRNGAPTIRNNIKPDPETPDWRMQDMTKRYLSSAALPLRVDSRVAGALIVYSDRPDFFEDDEVHLLQELADDISFALTKIEQEKQRRTVQKALKESEAKYRTIFETTGAATVLIDEDMTISLANREFAKLAGLPKEELEGKKKWPQFVADEELGRLKTYHRLRRTHPEAAPNTYETRARDQHGNVRDLMARVSMIPGTTTSVASFVDITDRKKSERALRESEQQLRFLSTQLLKAHESERKRVAQELHDGIGQILTAIKFSLENVLRMVEKNQDFPARRSLKSIVPVVQGGIDEIRRICADLRPSILDDLGILATISWLSREFQSIYSQIRVETDLTVRERQVPNFLKIVIYRILQEALTNVAKHSQADRVHLSLEIVEDVLTLSIEDNGRGFDTTVIFHKVGRGGFGLPSMQERAELSGGAFSVSSVLGSGTTIRASWPIPGTTTA